MIEPGYYNIDCMDGLQQMPDQYIDLAILDPPYGIKLFKKGKHIMGIGGGAAKAKAYKPFDDSQPPEAAYFKEIKRVCKKYIIWGGNYFLNYLPPTECFIVWDKGRRDLNYADCELAYTNIKSPSRIFTYTWDGMRQEDMKNKEYRIHPTQKPVALYEWLLSRYANKGDLILDTHVGSGSSIIAARRQQFNIIGYEIDTDYYKESVKRIEQETAQITIYDILKDNQ